MEDDLTIFFLSLLILTVWKSSTWKANDYWLLPLLMQCLNISKVWIFSNVRKQRSLNKSIKTKRLFEGKRKIQTEILIKSIRQSALINHLKKRKENQLERKAKKSRKGVVLSETERSLYDKLSNYKTIIYN